MSSEPRKDALKKHRRSAGLCLGCGGKPEPGYVRCFDCLAKKRHRQYTWLIKRSAVGLCRKCDNKRESDKTLCKECARMKQEANRDKRKKASVTGRCHGCHRPALPTLSSCETCWFANVSSRLADTRAFGPALKQLIEEQDWKCILSGAQLVPGVNASLDHRLPISRGGSSEIGNVQWVTKTINRMKTDLTNDEFIELCRVVSVNWCRRLH